MVEVREKNRPEETQKDRYDLNNELKILCFIKGREDRNLKTYGATIKRGLNMNKDVYRHLGALEKEEKIFRYEINRKKFVKLTKYGEETVLKCFLEMFPGYETNALLEKFVTFLATKTEQFLKERHTGLDYIPERYLFSLSEELRILFNSKLREFCRDARKLQIEVEFHDS